MEVLLAPTSIDAWAKEHSQSFIPPVCNKLMHKKQLTIMFVGGPNSRTDFHLEEGSELFLQLKGTMQLPTVQQGKRKLVEIKQGQFFVLPPRIPHSPQRPEAGSLGLVIERERVDGEMDGLRWYTDFQKCEDVLFERFFVCKDLGKDLVPVVQEFMESQEKSTGVPTETSIIKNPPLQQDMETIVPDPIDLSAWLDAHQDKLSQGQNLDLLAELGHPDKEFDVKVFGTATTTALSAYDKESFLYQLKGSGVVEIAGKSIDLQEGCCCVLGGGDGGTIKGGEGSFGMLVRQRKVVQ